jgi:hypothetical protein
MAKQNNNYLSPFLVSSNFRETEGAEKALIKMIAAVLQEGCILFS